MKSRIFMVFLIVGLVSLTVGPTLSLAKTYKFTVASAWEKTHPNNIPLFHLMKALNNKGKTKDGNLDFRWLGGPETFKASDLPDACRAGSVDFFLSSNLYYEGMVPECSFTSLPYGWSFEDASKMFHSGIDALVDTAWQKKGLKVVDFQSLLGFYFFMHKPFDKLSDFEGKKIRVPGGLFAYLPDFLGAVSTPLASAETYGALQRGTIDGALQPFSSYVTYSYWEVGPYVLAHPLTINGTWYWTNLDKFKSLPLSLQKKFMEVVRSEEPYDINFWKSKNTAWHNVLRKHNVKFITFSPADQKEFLRKIMKLKDIVAKQVPPEESKKLFEIYDKFAK